MCLDMKKILNQLRILLLVGAIILIGQRVGYGVPIMTAIPGMLIIAAIAVFAIILKELMPKAKIPAFAWASLTALILTMPFMPTAAPLLGYMKQVNYMAITTPILAFAGISVGNRIAEFKRLSWKIVVISFVVFAGTFFGSAIVAQIVLKLQGII